MRTRLLKALSWLLGLNHRKLLELLDWPIRLKVHLVVVYDGLQELNRLGMGIGVAKEVREFYRRTCNIDLHITVSGRPMRPWADESYVDHILWAHRFKQGGESFLILLRVDTATLTQGHVGRAFIPWGETSYLGGVCAVAGLHSLPDGTPLAGRITIHELGHLLLGIEHEDDTFIDSIIEEATSIVTKAQRARARETAARFGGL